MIFDMESLHHEVEDINDPTVIASGDWIEHKSYPGKQLYVIVSGTSVTLYENEEDKANNKVFATAGRTSIIKRHRTLLPKGKEPQNIDKAKKKLDFGTINPTKPQISELTGVFSNINMLKPFCPPHKMMPHPTLPLLYCEYGCPLIKRLDI